MFFVIGATADKLNIGLLQEYATHPLVHDTNRHFAEKYIECSRTGAFIGLKEIQLKIKDLKLDQKVYSVNFSNETRAEK